MWWHMRRSKISSFGRNGRVHLNQPGGRQFSRLLAADVCASVVVTLDTTCSEVVWRVLATHYIRQIPLHFPLTCVTVCHHISTSCNPSLTAAPDSEGLPKDFLNTQATSKSQLAWSVDFFVLRRCACPKRSVVSTPALCGPELFCLQLWLWIRTFLTAFSDRTIGWNFLRSLAEVSYISLTETSAYKRFKSYPANVENMVS